MKNLTIKAKYWLGYWPLTLVISAIMLAFDWRRRHHPLNNPVRILVVMIEHIGDIIVSTPFLHALRINHPDAHITVVTSKSTSSLLEHCPYIDKLISANNEVGWFKNLMRAFKLGSQIRALNADIAIIPKDAHNEDFNELICLLAACPQRISRARPEISFRVKPLKFPPFYNRLVIDDVVRHEADQRIRLTKPCGSTPSKLEAWLTPEDWLYADQFLSKLSSVKKGPLVSFGIGASAGGRCWPLDNYARVIERLGRDYDITALAIIGPSEIGEARKLQQITNYPLDYATSATVRQSVALIQRSALFIGNDSGPMHMAASVGVPVVEISTHPQSGTPRSINSPDRFGAYGVPTRVLRPKAMEPRCAINCASRFVPHCITNVTVDMVIQAAMELLDETYEYCHEQQATSTNNVGI